MNDEQKPIAGSMSRGRDNEKCGGEEAKELGMTNNELAPK
jgi:hypothetical protein